MVLMNHSSMIDGFALTASLPHRHVGKVRTLAKAGLFKLPVFGGMMTDCGHFPVHFNSKKRARRLLSQPLTATRLTHHQPISNPK